MTGTRRKIMAALAVLVLVGASASAAQGSGEDDVTSTRLVGLQEVPPISTVGVGTFRIRMVRDDAFTFRLTYNKLESPVTQAHIHFAQRRVAGGVSVFLCSNLTTPAPPPGTAACPTPSGVVTGTITADDVVGPVGQGITAGEFDELVRAIRVGATYANVHTTIFTGGEIRGQIPRHH